MIHHGTHAYFILHRDLVYREHAWFVKTDAPQVRDEDCRKGNIRCLHFYAYSLLLNNFKTTGTKITTPYEDGMVATREIPLVIANLQRADKRLSKCAEQEGFVEYCKDTELPDTIIEKLVLPYIRYWKFMVHQLQNNISELADFFKEAEKEHKNIGILGI